MEVFFMASKGQKFNKYTLDFKLKVLEEYKAGSTSGYLSRKYAISVHTIKTWQRIEKKYGTLGVAKRGRPEGENTQDYKERYEILKKFQNFLDKKGQKKK
jgi:hypothetical protein